jgi:N-dimethylarginine dimethylaminohydrolase
MANRTSARTTTPETNVDFNGHSMVGRLERVIVCSPRTAGWDDPDRLSRWQELGFLHRPDVSVAQAQHEALCGVLQRAEAEIVELAPSPDLTLDAVYAHDASLPSDFGLIPLNPGKANRVPEAKHHRDFLRENGTPTLGEISSPGIAEAGDIVWLDAQTLLVGLGYRTNRTGIEQMQKLLQPHGVDVLTAPLPYGLGPLACLHLMSLISLLDETTALVDLPWLAVETVELLKARGYRFVEIDYSERETLACNVLSLGENRLVAIDANEKTNQRLSDAGFEVFTFPGSEICINGSGGPTCLTRPLLRG